jgi:hypothetical protein
MGSILSALLLWFLDRLTRPTGPYSSLTSTASPHRLVLDFVNLRVTVIIFINKMPNNGSNILTRLNIQAFILILVEQLHLKTVLYQCFQNICDIFHGIDV